MQYKNLVISSLLMSSLTIVSSCGIEIHEQSSPMVRESGQLTIVNETYDDQIKVEIALAEIDRGHIPNLHVKPKGKSVRRFSLEKNECDPYSYSESCKRTLRFYRNGRLSTYCNGRDVLKVDYRCHDNRCEPIQDDWQDMQCFDID